KMTSEEQPPGPAAPSSARPQRSGPRRRGRGFRPSRRPRRPLSASSAQAEAQKPQRETESPQESDAMERTGSPERHEPSQHSDIEAIEAESAPVPQPVAPEIEGSTRRADATPAIRQAIEEV